MFYGKVVYSTIINSELHLMVYEEYLYIIQSCIYCTVCTCTLYSTACTAQYVITHYYMYCTICTLDCTTCAAQYSM
jgi:hypothetical protein